MISSELTGVTLDWAVAKALKINIESLTKLPNDEVQLLVKGDNDDLTTVVYSPSTNWNQGGLIVENKIDNWQRRDTYFYAHRFKRNTGNIDPYTWKTIPDEKECFAYGPTLLIACLRCYVTSVLGDTIELPNELK